MIRLNERAAALLFALGLMTQVSTVLAGSVSAQASSYAAHLRDEALVAVAGAQDRVMLASEALQQARLVEGMARDARDAAAVAVASEAVAEAGRGVQDARKLLERAKALLSRREKQVRDAALLAASDGSKDTALRGALVKIEGEVSVFDRQNRAQDGASRPLRPGDRVVTGKDGRARLILAGGDGDLILEPNSDLKIMRDDPQSGFEAFLKNGYGRVRARIADWVIKKFEVRTPAVVLADRGTEFSVQTLLDGVRVGVQSGQVLVTPFAAGSEAVELNAGEQREWSRTAGWGRVQALNPSAARADWGN